MKAYDAKQLVAISRYQNYFPSLPEEIREEAYARISGLIEEETARVLGTHTYEDTLLWWWHLRSSQRTGSRRCARSSL